MIAVLFGNLFSKTAMKNKGTFFQIFFHLKIDFFLEWVTNWQFIRNRFKQAMDWLIDWLIVKLQIFDARLGEQLQ
jgi:hypothetical protein